MKTITYISQATSSLIDLPVPQGLAMVCARSRRANSRIGVTSVLAYRNGYYLQSLEGPDNAVDSVFEAIKQDSLHQNLSLIFGHVTAKRYFPNWPMKLTSDIKKMREFSIYMESCVDEINNLTSEQLNLLGLFIPTTRLYKLKNKRNKTYKNKRTDSLQYSLTKWPNFNEIEPTPETLELCAKLVGKNLNHNEVFLNASNQIQRQKTEKILAQLKQSGLLIVKRGAIDENTYSRETQVSTFFSKLKNYLSKKVAV